MTKQNRARAREQALPGHLATFQKSKVCDAFLEGLQALVPSGNRRQLAELFGGRITPELIDHWRAGRRQPMQWARDIVKAKLAAIGAIAPRIGPAIKADPRPQIMRYHAQQRALKEKPRLVAGFK